MTCNCFSHTNIKACASSPTKRQLRKIQIKNPFITTQCTNEHINSTYKATDTILKTTSLVSLLSLVYSPAAFAATQATLLDHNSNKYTPSPMEPSFEIWVGFVAGVIPFAIASYEFGKRILIQRRCAECNGRGLVQRGRYLRKCSSCGGMLPWLGWKAFWISNLNPGNGGPLLQPKGQTSVLYSVPPPLQKQNEAEKEIQQAERKESSSILEEP